MIAVHLIAGDDNGGPYAHATVDLDVEVDDVTDEQVTELREGVRDLFRRGYGEEPQQVIVYMDETPDA